MGASSNCITPAMRLIRIMIGWPPLALAQHRQPELIIVYDNPDGGIDALKWLEMQHTARLGWLAAVPLMILADASRAAELRPHELSDRVTVVLRRSDTLNQLSRTVKRLLNVNRW
jgi:hypothetical protein